MKVFHRIDDIQEYNYQMKCIIDFFEANVQEYILGVIPKNVDLRWKDVFKSIQHGEVWQHGYSHGNYSKNDGMPDEFPNDLKLEYVSSYILDGKHHLEVVIDKKINGYIPPYNRCSEVAYNALKNLGFEGFSSDTRDTRRFLLNKDISIDIIEEYTPKFK